MTDAQTKKAIHMLGNLIGWYEVFFKKGSHSQKAIVSDQMRCLKALNDNCDKYVKEARKEKLDNEFQRIFKKVAIDINYLSVDFNYYEPEGKPIFCAGYQFSGGPRMILDTWNKAFPNKLLDEMNALLDKYE